jgi:hypothetical protein
MEQNNDCEERPRIIPDDPTLKDYRMLTETTPPLRHEVIMWDWKERIDLDHLNDAIKKVFDGHSAPRIHQVDTGQDCFAIIVASTEMTQEQVQSVWEARN